MICFFDFSKLSLIIDLSNFSENLISKDKLQLVQVKADKSDLKEHEQRLADIEKLFGRR